MIHNLIIPYSKCYFYALLNILGAEPGYFASLNEMRIRVLLLLVILFIFGGCLILLFCGYKKKRDIGTRAIDRELIRKAMENQPEQNPYVKVEIANPTIVERLP